jgi:hypothetical protein
MQLIAHTKEFPSVQNLSLREELPPPSTRDIWSSDNQNQTSHSHTRQRSGDTLSNYADLRPPPSLWKQKVSPKPPVESSVTSLEEIGTYQSSRAHLRPLNRTTF